MATVKTVISIDQGLFEQAEQAAKEMKLSRSSFFVLAVEDFLRRRENKQLLEKLNAVYAEPLDDEERAFLKVSHHQA